MFSNNTGYFYFMFKKVNGSVRLACGTVDPEIIARYHTFSETSNKAPNPDMQVYFDLDALAFRSFKKANFIEYITEDEYNAVNH